MQVRSTLARGGLAAVAMGTVAAPAYAVAPPADTIIGNQAIATYQNAVGETITVESNLVETIVNQVAGVDIEVDTTKEGAPGSLVYFPHTITNTGNGPDIFDLTAVDDDTGTLPITPVIYADVDLDGVPDSLTPITSTPSLNPGEVFGVVIGTQIPTTATPTDTEEVTVTVTSQTTNTVTDQVTDTLDVSIGAIIELTKSMTPSNVQIGDTVTVTLTYTNTGLADANNVVITDPITSELTYTTGSAQWSDSGSVTDGSDGVDGTNGVGDTIDYDFGVTNADEMRAAISLVPAGRSATLTFQAVVAEGAEGVIENTAEVSVDGGPDEPSNEATIQVDPTVAFTLADTSSSAPSTVAGDQPDDNLQAAGASTTDTDAALDDVVTDDGSAGPLAPGYAQGAVIPFETVLTNHSNVAETVNLEMDPNNASTFPAGTTFRFVDASGVPLTDSDGDGKPDVVVAADDGTTPGLTTVRVVADLPNDPSSQRAASDPAWTAPVRATSSTDDTVFNDTTLSLAADVVGDTVDLENAGGLADGTDVANGSDPWTTEAVDPGETASFTLVIQNTGGSASSYDLAYSGSNSPFAASAGLPADFQVRFLNGAGAEISNTGLIAAGQQMTVTAEVIVPAQAAPGDVDIYYQASSPTNGAIDVKLDRVTVNSIVDLVITPDQQKQAAPGGIVALPHTITNNGNEPITEGALTTAGNTDFSSTLYYDADGNGVLDPTDPVIDNLDDIVALTGNPIAPGDSVTIFNRTQVQSQSTAGQSETGTVSLSDSLNGGTLTDQNTANNAVDDTVTIVSGDLELVKTQAIDANCDNNPGAFVQTQLTADPGQCIRYRLVATNTGTADAALVTIDDNIPAFTTFTSCAASACAAAGTDGDGVAVAPTTPAEGATGNVEAAFGTLTPGEDAELQFTVQIDN